jgi:hypothetical protein
MMHEKKLYTSYFEGVLRSNRISNAYPGLNLTLTFRRSYILKKNTNERLIFQVEFHLCFVRKSAIKIV